jgi:hypothetical protein
MSATSTFDLIQTAFLFNLISNASGSVSGTAQEIADFTYAAVTNGTSEAFDGVTAPGMLKTLGSQLIGGDWELVWGPGIYQIQPKHGQDTRADNTAFVVYSASEDTYIVAIAGTDANSWSDWFLEDFEVGSKYLVNWPLSLTSLPSSDPEDSSIPQISLGTAKGVYWLLTSLTQSTFSPNPSQTLQAYLSSLQQNAAGTTKLIVTGHSLGGALSPTVAYWAQTTLSASNTQWVSQVFALPTAGPTPGNSVYAADWDSAFPPYTVDVNSANTISSLNSMIWNTSDLVPHTWQYIYADTQDTSSTQPYFFWAFEGHIFENSVLQSQLGEIQGLAARAIYDIASSTQDAGTSAGMTISAHTTPYPTVWPITYYDSNNQAQQLQQPTPPLVDGISPILTDLGIIHVWGYNSAFGIDASTIASVNPVTAS